MSAPVYGFIRAPWDAHSLGVTRAVHLAHDAGAQAFLADGDVLEGLKHLATPSHSDALVTWVVSRGVTHLGLTYRLDPNDGYRLFRQIHRALSAAGLLGDHGQVRRLFFAGLPEACALVTSQFGPSVVTFDGEETAHETAERLGIPGYQHLLKSADPYDSDRMSLAQDLVSSGRLDRAPLPDRGHYADYGTSADTLEKRLAFGRRGDLPLLRTHLGPYDSNREAAITLLSDWLRTLGNEGLLDVASLGTSQLTQERFGQDWADLPNGGGVPVNSPMEYERLWRAGRPLLMRTYAGTRNIRELAAMHESALHIAWHTLSLWWFCEIDGRGPNTVADNLAEHAATISDIAARGGAFEANVPHHFAFRGADDVTYVVSAVLAARLAKQLGIKTYVLQVMLSTPAVLSGTADLARARATVDLVRRLEDPSFRVVLQPRAGLDYFSTDIDHARAQLSAISMLMDDIESSAASPQVIHVVNYSEAQHLADVAVISESLRITLGSLVEYRRMRGQRGPLYDREAVHEHHHLLVRQALDVLDVISRTFPGPLTPQSMFDMFQAGFLPVPDLAVVPEKYPEATRWPTRATPRGVFIVDKDGKPIPPIERAQAARERVMSRCLT